MTGKQKAPELSAGLLAVKGSAIPAQDMKPREAEPAPEPTSDVVEQNENDANNAPLNFRVSAAFRREFKTFAAQHDLKLNELLRRAFDVYKSQKSA